MKETLLRCPIARICNLTSFSRERAGLFGNWPAERDLAAASPRWVLQSARTSRCSTTAGVGPLLVLVRDTRVALGRREAQGIIIEKLPHE